MTQFIYNTIIFIKINLGQKGNNLKYKFEGLSQYNIMEN